MDGQEPKKYNASLENEILLSPQKEDLMRWQLDSLDIIQDIEHDLRGDVWDEKKNEWIVSDDPRINEKGIRELISFIKLRVNKNVFLTDLSDKEINNIMINFRLDLVDLLYEKYRDYGIRKENLSTILNGIDDFVKIAIKRGWEALTLKHLGERVRTIERLESSGENKDGGKFIPSIWSKR